MTDQTQNPDQGKEQEQQAPKQARRGSFWRTPQGLKALEELFSDQPLSEESKAAIRAAARKSKEANNKDQ